MVTLLLSGILGGVILVILYLSFGRFTRFEKLGILCVKPRPIFGNMAPALFRRCPLVRVIDNAYRLSESAEYVGLYDFSEPIIVVRSPELIKNIAVKYFDHFVDHRGFVDVKQDPLFGKNLFSLCGEKWKRVRSLLTPTFTSSKMRGMFKLMRDCGENFATSLAAESAANGAIAMDVKDAFTRYTNDVIATCAFGITVDSMRDPNNDFYVLGRKTTRMEGILTLKFFLLSGFPRLSKWLGVRLIDPVASKFFESIVGETIARREREGTKRPDMIQLMMETRDGGGESLSIQDMAAQAFGFFFAGFDSSSAFMCFLAHEIAINREIQERLCREIDDVVEKAAAAADDDDDEGGRVSYEAINSMEYLEAVVSEGLRKYPGAPFLDRRCVKTFELPPARPGGKPVVIEPGTTVWFPVFAIHRDPKYYPEPDKFDPERFMGRRRDEIDPFTYFPFGQGPRMCIGYRFALLEAKVVFFHLLAKCHLKRGAKTVVPIHLSKGSFGLAAEGGFWLEIESRNGRTYGESSA